MTARRNFHQPALVHIYHDCAIMEVDGCMENYSSAVMYETTLAKLHEVALATHKHAVSVSVTVP